MELTESALAELFEEMLPHLDERQRRLLMGAQARALGRGGIRAVARAARAREATVSLGAGELEAGAEPLGRARRRGCGRRCWPWWSRICAGTLCRRCGGRRNRPGRWRRN